MKFFNGSAGRRFPASLMLAALLVAAPALAGQKYSGKITKLSDGDTFQFQPNSGGSVFKVRMIATDTAETHLSVPGGMVSQGYWGDQGAAELAKYLKINDQVTLEVFGEDTYGRKLGRVFKNGQDVNLKMVRSGWASLYLICESDVECRTGSLPQKDYDAYREACQDAVADGLGLFSRSRPVPQLPFVFRAEAQRKGLLRYVADVTQDIYFAPEDYESVDVCDRVFYSSEADAEANGFDSAR